jgi:hypothetical protein
MQWSKHEDEQGYGHGIRVWKKGAEVEFDDLYDRSYLVLDAIRTNKMVKTEFMNSVWYKFAINKKHCSIEPWVSELHCAEVFLRKRNCLNDNFKPIGTDEQYKAVLTEYYETWREYHIGPEFVEMIKEFDSMMEIVRVN